jgi:glycosyltransferase involved in cell wall biosynthesis
MSSWAILTGEYPPQAGGVSDYTRLVAEALAEAGDEVHVWCPPSPGAQVPPGGPVRVHRLPDHFGPRSLARLDRALRGRGRRLTPLVQYVPQAFGWKGMNLPFCAWVASRLRGRAWVMFHEVAFPLRPGQPLAHTMLGVVTRMMARLMTDAARRIYLSIPAWEGHLRSLAPVRAPVTWLPVPSNLPHRPAPRYGDDLRHRLGGRVVVGHFGTFGASITPLLSAALPPLLARDARRVGLLVGRGGEAYAEELARLHPTLRGRLIAPGALPADEVVAHLAACDVLLQPYPDGVSGRRTSLMAGLSLGLPTVTTEGPLSEPLWRQSGAVALTPVRAAERLVRATDELLADPQARARLGARGAALYEQHFALPRTVHLLRSAR